jgi:MoxR-like ATPase
MRIVIETPLSALGYELAADLEEKGFGPVRVLAGEGGPFEMRHAPGTPAAAVTRFLAALKPLVPDEVGAHDDVPGDAIVLRLGDFDDLSACVVDLAADSEAMLGLGREVLDGLELRCSGARLAAQDIGRLHHAPGHVTVRRLLRWALARRSVEIDEQEHPEWGDESNVLQLRLRDAAEAKRPLRERFEVEVATDDADAVERLSERLRADGFRCRPVAPLPGRGQLRFRLLPGPFTQERAPADFARLRLAVEDVLTTARIDAVRHPLETDPEESAVARIELPLRMAARGELRAYAGPFPERFHVTVHTDSPDAVGTLTERLRTVGFKVRVEPIESLAETPGADVPAGFQVHWGAAGREPIIADLFGKTVAEVMHTAGIDSGFGLEAVVRFGDDDTDIWLFYPVKGVADGLLADRLADPGRFRLKVHSPEKDEWADLIGELEKWGFEGVEVAPATAPRSRKRIEFGGAPPALVERILARVRALGNLTLPQSRAWDVNDTDIWLHLPKRTHKPEPAKKDAGGADLAGWLTPTAVEAATVRPYLDVGVEQVRVGGVRLPRRPAVRGPFVPDPGSFGHFCLDGCTAETLEHLAASILLREPCLLEGETSTSKTSSILFLASLLRQPVVRINLNGQTDTGELIGRFVPSSEDKETGRQGDKESGNNAFKWASGAYAEAAESSVSLSPCLPVSLSSSTWRWQDGLVVQALKQGWWVLLDEVNLAEPQILERLNSVLETEPSLVLTEHDNSAIGKSGEPVHPHFRIFATMNPAEYAGRTVLSPAYRDRWRGYRFVPRPGEHEYLAMLRLLVHGEQPGVIVQGRRYSGGRVEARYPSLAGVLTDPLLIALARFQSTLEHAAGQSGEGTAKLGTRRKERYVFTRRGLLSMLDFLASPLGVGPGRGDQAVRAALLRYYLGRMTAAEDQATVVQLLDAAGIGPNSWSVRE